MKPRSFLHTILFLTFLGAFQNPLKAQDTDQVHMPELGPNDTIPVPAMIFENQYIPGNVLPWMVVSRRYPKHLLRKKREWTRLRNAVYVTYPYARKAGIIMNDININLAKISDREERKKYLKTREKE